MRTGSLIAAALLAALLPACQQEELSRRSTISQQFAQLNKQGWNVQSNEARDPNRPRTTDDPNVRVIRGADFSNVQFRTNFQIDDPALRAQYQATDPGQNGAPAAPQPAMTPFGPGAAIPH